MDFTISICVLTTDEQNFRVRDCESAACPKRIFHAHSQHDPLILFNLILLDSVVDFLLGATKETSEGVDVLITD